MRALVAVAAAQAAAASGAGRLSAAERRVAAFPDYDDPIAAVPPITRPRGGCTVPLITAAAIDNYYQRVAQPFPGVPAACRGSGYSLITLDWDGAVKGVQFDRFGALWLAGVEILRTTTPEPSPAGIRWQVSRDLTSYASLFEAAAGKDAVLSIPNVIDGTYTGVLHVNATLTFYPASRFSAARAVPDAVIPLHPPVRNESVWPWDSMGHWNGSASVALQGSLLGSPRLQLDVYASAHGCEEFWYTNVPDEYVNETGACGGGAARLLVVYVDGKPAGALPPFPVIYTGGVCPLLWRPLTGIQSFDVPPYTFDLSPFAPVFSDGEPHVITVEAVGSNSKGVWYIDPVLTVTAPRGDADIVVGGSVSAALTHDRPTVSVSGQSVGTGMVFRTEWPVAWLVNADIRMKDGRVTRSSVSGTVSQTNTNEFHADGSSIAFGQLTSSSRTSAGRESTRDFPYSVYSNYSRDAKTLEINGTVGLSFQRSETFPGWGIITWSDSVNADATYNRSLASHDDVYKQLSASDEEFAVRSTRFRPANSSDGSDGACWRRSLAAEEGSVTKNVSPASFRCATPPGVFFCGYELCGEGLR